MLGQLDFDIILADYNLQDWTGLDALDILKASGKNIPVIMVTGSLGDEAAVACIKEGAADYVLKDRVARLPLAVRSALKERELLGNGSKTPEALRQSEERYRDLFENANDLIHSFTPDGRILYANRAWKNALGYSDEEIGNLTVSQIIHPDSRESWAEQMDRLLRAESENKAEISPGDEVRQENPGRGEPNLQVRRRKPVIRPVDYSRHHRAPATGRTSSVRQ